MNFRTLKDLNKDKKDDKNENNAYVGGEKSGLAVQKNPDIQSKILNKARNQSKEQNPSEKKDNRPNLVITMYKDGFMVSDAKVLRSYEDTKNKKFLEELSTGVVPEELRKTYPNGINVGLQDLRSKNFNKEKPKKKNYFEGKGIKLSDKIVSTKINVKDKNLDQIDLINNEKVFQLQLRFSDGTKKVLDVNPSTRMKQISVVVKNLLKKNFKITTIYPVKDITNADGTLDQLDLLDSTVNIKIL